MDLEQLKATFAGKRVQFVGMFGKTDGPVGKVWRVQEQCTVSMTRRDRKWMPTLYSVPYDGSNGRRTEGKSPRGSTRARDNTGGWHPQASRH